MKLQLIFEPRHRSELDTLLAQTLPGGHEASCQGAAQTLVCTELLDFEWTVLRLELPWTTGLGLIARVRRTLPQVGILVTHADQGVAECVQAYDAGADMFMNEPASEVELQAMAQAMVRRLGQASLRALAQGVPA